MLEQARNGPAEEEVTRCWDGTVVVVSSYGREALGKRYFVGPAVVPFEAPRDRLRLIWVDGKPGIVELPIAGVVPPPTNLVVIERFPTPEKPGILVGVGPTDKSLSEAVEPVGRMMRKNGLKRPSALNQLSQSSR